MIQRMESSPSLSFRNRVPPFRSSSLVALACLSLLGGFGCDLQLTPDPSAGDDLTPPGSETGRPEDVVTVRFRNYSFADAVDVEFFVASQPVTVLPGDLFVEDNRLRANVGFAGTGLVPPRQQDVIVIPCTQDLVIGTSGGTFFDAESGELRGSGVARWAEAAPLGICGSLLTFDFTSADDTFTTAIEITND